MLHKLKAHHERIKKEPKLLVIIVLAAILIVAIILLDPFSKKIPFSIEDKCGKFVNLMSHTIEDGNKCKTRCIGQCDSQDLGYSSINFEEFPGGCNKCTCYCK